jgi:hypothetical protein
MAFWADFKFFFVRLTKIYGYVFSYQTTLWYLIGIFRDYLTGFWDVYAGCTDFGIIFPYAGENTFDFNFFHILFPQGVLGLDKAYYVTRSCDYRGLVQTPGDCTLPNLPDVVIKRGLNLFHIS